MNAMSYLVLIRHGESEWNAKGLWTGLTDIPLNDKGKQEAKNAAKAIKDIKFDICFTSKLKRAKETLFIIGKELGSNLPIKENKALNERDYGEFTGKNKWEIKKSLGEYEFIKLRRGWDRPIKNGETLKDVYNRVIPYYKKEILPKLIKDINVLIVAHGNSIRALVKFLENIKDQNILSVELKTGEIYVYQTDNKGNVVSKEIRS